MHNYICKMFISGGAQFSGQTILGISGIYTNTAFRCFLHLQKPLLKKAASVFLLMTSKPCLTEVEQ